MARRFRGSDTYKVDGKGRVSIPASFRRVIEASDPDWTPGSKPGIVIVYGDAAQSWLEVYTMEAIDEIDRQISLMQRGSPERNALEDLMNGYSMDSSVDEDGRLVLPSKLREKIGIRDEAFFFSKGDYFQIWNPQAFQEAKDRERARMAQALPEGTDPRVLLPQIPGS